MKKVVGVVRAGLLAALALQVALPGHAATTGALRLLQQLPAPGSVEVPLSGLVSLIFDRPVVPLARLGAGPIAATITPPIAGQQRWLGTTTWAVVPAHGLAPATTYTVRLNSRLRALDGAAPGAAIWRFTTLRPAVSGVFPNAGATGLLPRVPVDIRFNLPVVRALAEAHFHLRLGAHGATLAGAFSWRNATTMRFTPALPLPRGSFPRVNEAAGVLALGGPLPSTRPFASGFGVAPAFALSSSQPSDGDTSVDSYNPVALHFTAPVDLRAAPRYVSVSPRLSALHIDVGDQDTLMVSGDYHPSTAYRVTIRAGLPSLLGDRLPATRTISFQTAAYQPSLQLVNEGTLNTYDAYRGVLLYATVTNVARFTLNVYRQSEAQFLRVIAPSFNLGTYAPSGLPLMASDSPSVHAPLNKTVTISQRLRLANGAPLSPGYYVAVASAPGVSNLQVLPLLVTRSSLTLKYGDSDALVWANDLRSGAALAGLPVRIVDGNGRLIMRGRTGSDGVFMGHAPPGYHLAYQPLRALLDRPGDAAAVGSEWSNGISSYDYNLPFDTTLARYRLYLNTDRPIYRPGQTIYFRGLARGDDDGRYHMLPAGLPLHITAYDALNHTILNRQLRLNGQGIFAGQLALPNGASLGNYSVQATLGARTVSAYVLVAAYKKPTFQVQVLPDRGENGNYVNGEHIGVAMHALYYFGSPLAHAPIQWSVSSAATPFQPPAGYDDYTFVDQDVLDQLFQAPSNYQVTQVNGQTGALGQAALRLPASVQGSPLPQTVTIEANVTSPTQQQVAQRSTVTVNPAGLYVGLRPQDYVLTPRTPQAVDVVTLRPDGTPAPRARVTLLVQRRTTYSVQTYDPQLGFIWQNHNRDVTIHTLHVLTNGAGRATLNIVLPTQGEYRLAGSAPDGLGNTARTAAYVYSMIAGSANYIDWGIGNNDRIKLVADRRQYAVGQTAHILVAAPFSGMSALVTLERGTIQSHRVVALRGNSPVLAIPITADAAPNLYVSVVLFKGSGASAALLPVWKMGYLTLAVDPRERALTVLVRAPGHARPGQRVSFALHAQDQHGHAVQADLGVSLVDAAVLALAQNSNGTAGDAFYAQRPLGIATAASMNLFIDRLDLTPGNGKKGGGAGGGGGGPAGASVRVKFPDTAYWNPNVLTNANGDAVVSLTLPDNLTTWRFSADGSTTAQTLLGTGSADLVSSKPVLIEPALPRFLTVRDTSDLGAVVSNTTARAVRLVVSGTAHAGTTTQSLAGQSITVPAGGDRAVYWPYVPLAQGQLTVTLRATAATPDLSDALAVSLPIEENSLLSAEAAATAGDVNGATATERVQLPGAIEPGEGDLRLTLEPSLVAGLGAAAAYLLSYPYDGVEQVTSRLTGMLALASLPARTFGLSAAQTAALPALETEAVARLYALQGGDGGWGWWPEDPSDPYLSAYAYEGLTFLHESGYAVDSTVLSNATNYLQGSLTAAPGAPNAPDDDTRAFILYALGRAGHTDGAAAVALYGRERALNAGARSELALALSAAFGPQDPRVQTLLHELADEARLTSIDAQWDAPAQANGETMETSVGDTALVLRTLVSFDPHTPLIARGIRWLMAQRGVGAPGAGPGPDGAWLSTQATALALRAVAYYALHAGDIQPRYSYTITVNGKEAQQGVVTPATAGQARVVAISTDALRAAGGRAVIQITRRALPGGPPVTKTPLHYTLRLRYYPAPGSVGAVQSGISVTRRYLTKGGAPLTGGAVTGSVLTEELRLIAPQDLSRVLIEDPLPAGAEAVDGTLLTSSIFAQPGAAQGQGGPGGSFGPAYAPPAPGQPQDLGLYLDHTELRDDRTALFATSIPAGTYMYRYTIHLTTPGLYHVLPAHATQLYEPEVFGHTAEGSMAIR